MELDVTWSPEYLEGKELGKASCNELGTSRGKKDQSVWVGVCVNI